MVLTDDNFASIVAAVEEGRGIFGNIKKYLMYLLSANAGEVLLVMAAVVLGYPLPLIAIQILYVNLATDGLPALALAVDPPEPDLMRRPPRPPRQSIFTRPVLRFLGVAGVWTGLVTLGVFIWALETGRPLVEAQGLTFVTLILIELFNAFNSRSPEQSLFKVGLFSNRWLLLAIAWELTLMSVIVYTPFLQGPFHTFSLGLRDWGVVLLASASILGVVELMKFLGLRLGWRRG